MIMLNSQNFSEALQSRSMVNNFDVISQHSPKDLYGAGTINR
jgi:hypothetical protein